MTTLRVVSVSGGKDSLATLLLAMERHPIEEIRAVAADTGNEHEITVDYLANYLPRRLNLPIHIVRASFTEEIARKKRYILEKWPGKGVPADVVERAAAMMVPTGNPFLDLCIWKGRFPSRMQQFCTQFLKTLPLVEYQLALVDEGYDVESWQGIRWDESQNRANALEREELGGGITVVRPILAWTAQQTIDYSRSRNVEHNALYRMGFDRVGCMPCINASKREIAEIARRFPEHIDRLEEWERLVGEASKRGISTFFPSPEDEGPLQFIRDRVLWSQTSRGGKQFDLEKLAPPPACSSSYGLCE